MNPDHNTGRLLHSHGCWRLWESLVAYWQNWCPVQWSMTTASIMDTSKCTWPQLYYHGLLISSHSPSWVYSTNIYSVLNQKSHFLSPDFQSWSVHWCLFNLSSLHPHSHFLISRLHPILPEHCSQPPPGRTSCPPTPLNPVLHKIAEEMLLKCKSDHVIPCLNPSGASCCLWSEMQSLGMALKFFMTPSLPVPLASLLTSAADSLFSAHSEWQAMSSPASVFAFTHAWHIYYNLQCLKCLWSSRTLFTQPYPQFDWEDLLWLLSLLLYLYGHMHIIHKTLGIWQPSWMLEC